MGCQELSRPPLSPRRLALEAVEARIQALQEYLTVYRAGSRGRGHRGPRLRELRRDIQRLEAWGWYLRAGERRPSWWRLLTTSADALGGQRRARAGQRRHQRHGVQRLSTFSVIDRAYVALMEDFQGRLLTLSLVPDGGDPRCRARLGEKVTIIEELRTDLARRAGRVTVICAVLAVVRRWGGWVGLHPADTRTVDS